MRPWRVAMQEALYGDGGFFRLSTPSEHFRTSAHTGHTFALAILSLLDTLDEALDRPDPLDVVDIGAGGGELLAVIAELAPIWLQPRLRLTAVELAPRPDGLPEEIGWQTEVPGRVVGLMIATEWLDNVPVDVVARDADGWRYVLVDDLGVETMGAAPDAADAAWLEAWWPDGERAEVGLSRDTAWASAVGRLERGLALAIDYGHIANDRPPLGSLSAYREGIEVQPVPDGSCDLTAHVALDAAGSAVAGRPYWLVRQSEALRALGLTGQRPPIALAHEDPGAYIRALADASVAAELTDVTGLGGHWWLWQPVGIDLRPPTMSG